MDDITLTALRGSIKKWEDIVHRDGEDRGSDNCPLCVEFLKDPPPLGSTFPKDGVTPRCEGCPVASRSGIDLCRGTPYHMWSIHATLYHFSCLSWVPKHVMNHVREIAQAELDFLKSLLPKGSE